MCPVYRWQTGLLCVSGGIVYTVFVKRMLVALITLFQSGDPTPNQVVYYRCRSWMTSVIHAQVHGKLPFPLLLNDLLCRGYPEHSSHSNQCKILRE